ncbi:hypothetical protein BCD48_40010 [Pseudofrankia sp. BMG5.36]|nr:hypothetical protein BCD48_40010 [Pseudofrankia sp. BMG5.36]
MGEDGLAILGRQLGASRANACAYPEPDLGQDGSQRRAARESALKIDVDEGWMRSGGLGAGR